MTLKPLYDDKRSLDRAYQVKLESRFIHSGSDSFPRTYHSLEGGSFFVSATGSATVAKTFSFAEKKGVICGVEAHALSRDISAHVTDVTKTSVTITCGGAISSASFSNITSAAITVYWSVRAYGE